MQITGLDKDDVSYTDKIYNTIEESLSPMSKVTELQPMGMYVEKHKKLGKKTKYSVRIKLPTQIGVFVVTHAHGWNLITVVQEAMNNLEREFWKKYEKAYGKKRDEKRLLRGK